jgi:hypothetical protein
MPIKTYLTMQYNKETLKMSIDHVLGILIILAAYGFTWYLLLRSTKIVKIIDREGLEHVREIKNILKRVKDSGGKKQ